MGNRFHRAISYLDANKYILVYVDYVSKWVEAQACVINDIRVVCKFLSKLFARFEMPQALKSDGGTHFCNRNMRHCQLVMGLNTR